MKLIEAEISPTPTPTARAERAKGEAAPAAARPGAAPLPPPPRPVPAQPLPTPSSGIWSQVIPLTRQEMAAADIARMPSRLQEPGSKGANDGEEATKGGDTPTVGTAPNGEPLYHADWYRRPRPAELSTYLPARPPRSGWGLIACQTAPNYRVENCQEIGQSPAGSGLAGAARQAAWQFRVLPPRIGGRQLIGAWVRIRIEYTQIGAE